MNETVADGRCMALDAFEWHDLPIARVSITGQGLELVVTPYDDETGTYRSCRLSVSDAEQLTIDLNGELSLKDLRTLEVSSFDHSVAGSGRVSGTIGILPGNAGFWEISFANALCSLEHA